MRRNIVKILSLTAILGILLSACAAQEIGSFSASGTFSAIDTSITSEISGKVVEINVTEGETVKTGQTLFKIEDEIIRAQYNQASAAAAAAEAAVEASRQQAASADAQYQLALQGALMQDLPARQAAMGENVPTDYRPAWYFSDEEQIKAAQDLVSEAEKALQTSLDDLASEQKAASSKDFIAAEERLAAAQEALAVAKTTKAQVNSAGDNDLEDAAAELEDTAQAEFDAALSEYDRMLTSSAADAIVTARSRVAVAQANLDNARDSLLAMQTGDQSLQVIAAQKAAEAAASAVKQAEAGLEQAKAALELAHLQLDRTEVKSPIDGVLLTRNLEVGDLVVAGGTVMKVAQLDTLELVVYLPEDEYGKVNIGDLVTITVDSFEGETFEGSIVRIADEAEFTPKNVQTESGRKSTVYAVKVQVENPDHLLKPGMPADVEFTIR